MGIRLIERKKFILNTRAKIDFFLLVVHCNVSRTTSRPPLLIGDCDDDRVGVASQDKKAKAELSSLELMYNIL